MAEFCVECWNSINGFDDSEEDYVLSRYLELCEGCGQWKRVVIRKRRYTWLLAYLFRRIRRRK